MAVVEMILLKSRSSSLYVMPIPEGSSLRFYRESALSGHGIDVRFVQENHSLSASRGVLRGLHFQIPPFAQAKLVRVTAGSIFDVAVDIWWGSPNFGRHVAVVLSDSEWNQIYIPEGFAHGFCTLEPNAEVVYKVSNYYSAEHDRGLCWNDPVLGIDWPISAPGDVVLSEKDQQHPKIADLPRYFQYEPPFCGLQVLVHNRSRRPR